MKTILSLLALSALLGTAYAQTSPAKPKADRAHAIVAANGKAIGRKFISKSKPTDMRMPPPLPRREVITYPQPPQH